MVYIVSHSDRITGTAPGVLCFLAACPSAIVPFLAAKTSTDSRFLKAKDR